jgi:hypothetical protein
VRDFQSEALKHRGLLFLIGGMFLVLSLGVCSRRPVLPSAPVYGFRPVRTEFNLGNTSRFQFKTIAIFSDKQDRLLLAYEKYDRASGKKLGEFFRISTDAGRSFGPERAPPKTPAVEIPLISSQLAFVKGGLVAVGQVGANLFYSRSETDGATWSAPVQINDEQDSVAVFSPPVQPSERDVYCLWADRRRGFPLIFFSASHDGGRTWSPNQAVEYDFREGEQTHPGLVAGADGRLLAFWTDARDRRTLKDIRGAYSDDGGQHWSASQRINDDTEPVWQDTSSVVTRGREIYHTFQDFRERGTEGAYECNVYFTRSTDNGQTWSKNVRVNDIAQGDVGRAGLVMDARGTLYCLWGSARESIFGHVFLAYSTDGGQSWSRAVQVDEGEHMAFRIPARLVALSGNKLLSQWCENRYGEDEYHLTRLEPLTAPPPAEASTPVPRPERSAPPALGEGERLFADDFSDGTDARWQTAAGIWMIVDGSYMGVEPGARAFFSSFARFKEPDRYILRGRFKLDPMHHQMAYIYFRANPAERRYYVIGNSFRIGACLSLRTDDAPPVGFGAFVLDGHPLAQRRFPFQNNHWYPFALVVTPERVDYYVDGRWMLSYEEPLKLPPGRVGIGGWSSAPTYFDDIAVYEKK